MQLSTPNSRSIFGLNFSRRATAGPAPPPFAKAPAPGDLSCDRDAHMPFAKAPGPGDLRCDRDSHMASALPRLQPLRWEGSPQQLQHAAEQSLPVPDAKRQNKNAEKHVSFENPPPQKWQQKPPKEEDDSDWSRAWPGTNADDKRQHDPRWDHWDKWSGKDGGQHGEGGYNPGQASSAGDWQNRPRTYTATRPKAPPNLTAPAESASEPSDSEPFSEEPRIPDWFRAVWARPHGNPPDPATFFGHPAAVEVITSVPSEDDDRSNWPNWLDFGVGEHLLVIAMDEGVAFAMAHCRSTPKFGFIPVGSANPEPGPFEFVVKLGRVDLGWMKLGLTLGKGTHYPYFAKVMGLERHSIIEQFNQSQRTIGLGREQLLLGDVITNASTARSGDAGAPMVYERIKETIVEACKHNLDLDLRVSRMHGQVTDGRPPWSQLAKREGAYVICD